MYSYKPETKVLITVFVPAYNHEKYVWEALESIRHQTYQQFELIIVDDKSTDNTAGIIQQWIEKFNVQCTFIRHEKNIGLVKTLNEIISISKGKYWLGIASDDLNMTDRLEKIISVFENLPDEFGLVCSNWENVNQNGEHLSFGLPPDFIFPENPFLYLLNPSQVLFQAYCFRTDYLKQIGLYSTAYLQEDYSMSLHFTRKYKVKYMPEVLTKYRVLQNSFGKNLANRPVMAYDSFRLLKSLNVEKKEEKKAVARQFLVLLEEFHSLNYYDRKLDLTNRKNQMNEMLNDSKSFLRSNFFFRWLNFCVRNNISFKKWLFVRNKMKRVESVFKRK